MSNFFVSAWRNITTALKNLGRHLAMTLSSASAVMVTLILMALFLVIAGNLENFTANVETNLKIHVSIDAIAEQSDINALENEIKALDGVRTVTFSNKEEELNILIKDSGSVFERYKDNNPMPNVFIVEAQDANVILTLTSKLNTLDHVDKAQYGGETIQNMIDTFEAIRTGGVIFIIALTLVAIFLISNTIKMTIYTRSKEISIMRNVGASNWYIRMPFMFEGMFIGMLGSVVPIIITMLGYTLFYKALDGNFVSSMFSLQPVHPFATFISLSLFVCGAVVGLVGSYLSVTRYLHWKR